MNDYYSVRIDFSPCSPDITDLAAAFLADAGFESFVPDENGLTAYIPADRQAQQLALEALADFPFDTVSTVTSQFIKGEDWNEVWEKNYFKPILIDDKCVVHSSFHTDVPSATYDIVIDPRMAFGTGHHDTTSQMIRHILDLPLQHARVIDMGTGTGILAILAKMRGADLVCGIEIDEPAYQNAIDHAKLNNVTLQLIHGDAGALDGLPKADFFFANINRNIILEDIERYSEAMNEHATLLLSGFYESDVPMIMEAASKLGFSEKKRLVSDASWTALRLER